MATIVYVDNDDEITSAAARIRDSRPGRVALVVPNGSRLSTSRINFRLLAREAQARDRRLAIVAADGATRSLAASAGLPVFGSVGEFEQSSDEAAAERPAAARVVEPAPPAPRAGPNAAATAAAARAATAKETVARPIPVAVASQAPTMVFPLPSWRPRLPAGRPAAAVAAGVLALAVVVLGVGAFLLLPSATITVTPHEVPMALSLSITADPGAIAPDPDAGVVPAQILSFDLSASDTFPVKGRRIEEAKATGRVTFSSYNTGSANTIPAGSIVSTEGGLQFRTRSAARLARAQLIPGAPGFSVIPSRVTVDVEAVRPGTSGNVAPNAITVVPRDEDPVLTRVTNRDPTEGGTHDEFPRIEQADLDAAVAGLRQALDEKLDAMILDRGRIPADLTVFGDTKSVTDPVPSVDPASLLGKEVESFELGMTSTGSVVAVDETRVAALVNDRISATVSAGHRLVPDSVQADLGQPSVDGQRIVFDVAATAAQVRVVDAADLIGRIKGKPIPQARAALEPYGDVSVSVWPDWVSSIPTIDARIDLRVLPAASAP